MLWIRRRVGFSFILLITIVRVITVPGAFGGLAAGINDGAGDEAGITELLQNLLLAAAFIFFGSNIGTIIFQVLRYGGRRYLPVDK